jgi:hypothetical protein
VFEQGNASRKIPMLEPSSFIVDTSHDDELARKLFGNLNHDILGPPGDGKIISLNDSDKHGEEQEEKLSISNPASADDAPASANDAPTSADDAPAEARINNSDDQGPDEEADGSDNGGRSAGDP